MDRPYELPEASIPDDIRQRIKTHATGYRGAIPGDSLQVASLAALDVFRRATIDLAATWYVTGPIDESFRHANRALSLEVELLTLGYLAVLPTGTTYLSAPVASMILRALTDVHANHLAAWKAGPADRQAVIESILAESRRRERLALEAAEEAGASVESLLAAHDRLGGAAPRRVNATDELAGDPELLAIFRWESGVLHAGSAYWASRFRPSGKTEPPDELAVDRLLEPPGPRRLGELSWALFGVGRRVISRIAEDLGRDTATLRQISAELEEIIRAPAQRALAEGEPVGLPYGDFDLPMWPPHISSEG